MQQTTQTLEVKSTDRTTDNAGYKMGLDDFFEKYKPVSNPNSTDGDEFWLKDCLYGLSQEDKDHVAEVYKFNPNTVWTVHHSDSGDIEWIKSGLHYVNHNGFIITNVPYVGSQDLIVHEDYRYLDAKVVINLKGEVDQDNFGDSLADVLEDSKFDIGAFSLEIDFDFESIVNFVVVKLSIIDIDSDPDVTIVVDGLRKIMNDYKESRPEIASFAIDVAHEVKSYF